MSLTGFVCAALAAATAGSAAAQLRPSRLVGDGMVIQRNASVPVWGWAEPGRRVLVTFDGQRHQARADATGGWKVLLPPREAGGPYRMSIETADERIEVQDILVGDVWIASGQSNMEWSVSDSRDAQREIAGARDRRIRHFKVPRSWAETPEPTLAGGEWRVADPAHVGEFSAVAYFFARELRAHLDVPIGIINTTWGGSRIEPWMSREALGLDDRGWEAIKARERAERQRILDSLRSKLGELPMADAGLSGGRAVWADPALDDAGWADIPVPGVWEQWGYAGLDGVAWYRTEFQLSAEEARAGARLGLGMIDDSDVAWVNGHEVGRTDNAYDVARVYAVPAPALRPGRNVVAVRVEDFRGGGGIHGGAELVYLETATGRRPLAGSWKFRVGSVVTELEGQKNETPTLLYNKMIHPLLPYPVRGALWYQGESNAYPGQALEYRDQFAGLITDWRRRWGVGDFPFLWVQLANYMQPAAEPRDSDWAVLRESQSAALALPNTAQAVAIDLGEADDIHPRNKQDVGRRLALAARRVAYGETELVHSGPVFRGHEMRDGRVVLRFDHLGSGLTARGDRLGGFAIAGPDRRFVWAEARIEGDRVVVWSDRVPDPVAVRYAWGDNPEGANLYNREGLPASPFRTDSW